jgi:hypothetical protein
VNSTLFLASQLTDETRERVASCVARNGWRVVAWPGRPAPGVPLAVLGHEEAHLAAEGGQGGANLTAWNGYKLLLCARLMRAATTGFRK